MDWSPLFISIRTAITATGITFFLGIYAAHKTWNSRHMLTRLLDGLFTLPLVLPPTVVGFILLIIFGKNGFIGSLLMRIGIEIIFTWKATVIASVLISFPLMYRSAKAAFEQVDDNLVFAGRTLGMSEVKIFWNILMPLALPGIASGGILSFGRALGEFGATLMIAGNIPRITQTMPVAIYTSIQSGRTERAFIWVGVTVILSLAVIYLMNFFSEEDKKHRNKK